MIRILLRQVGLLAILLLMRTQSVYGLDISKYDCSYWYALNPEVKFSHIVYQSDSSFHVKLKMVTSHSRQDSLFFFLQNTFTSEAHRVISPIGDTLTSSSRVLMLSFDVKKTNDNILMLHYRNNGDFLYPVQLRYNGVQHPAFYQVEVPHGLPSFDSFVRNDSCFLHRQAQGDSLWVYEYSDQFNAAEPPMSRSFAVSPVLIKDTLRRIHQSFVPQAGKFYFIQIDTLDLSGITRYAGSAYYPRYRTLEELIPPLIYIARKSERSKIENALDIKAAFDEFWLSLYPIKRNAASAIAEYYQSITHANQFFTDYKPGWKTDRGMIYIVFGPPVKVIKEDWREIWEYSEELSFEFRIISNLFAYQQYYLIRREQYEEPWYNAVRQLRNNQ